MNTLTNASEYETMAFSLLPCYGDEGSITGVGTKKIISSDSITNRKKNYSEINGFQPNFCNGVEKFRSLEAAKKINELKFP